MSTNYTQNYNLCQWEPEDPVLRTDFNADNAKIDAALAGKPLDPVWRDEVEKVSHRHYSTGFFYGQPGQYYDDARYVREWQVAALVTDCGGEGDATLSLRNKFRTGDTVELVSMGTKATVLSVNKDGSLQLQAGIMKITAKQEEVRVSESETQKSVKKVVERATHQLRSLGASPEVDLRGLTGDEAVMELDRFLDNAVMGRLQEVRIIHGKGTGAVRSAVRDHLKRSRYIKSFRPGRYGEGEDGVTIAELR